MINSATLGVPIGTVCEIVGKTDLDCECFENWIGRVICGPEFGKRVMGLDADNSTPVKMLDVEALESHSKN